MVWQQCRRAGPWLASVALLASSGVRAADIGGFLADQQKAREIAAARAADDSCPQLIARAAAEDGAPLAYRAALCYFDADPPDPLAARAWLVRSAELGFMPAQRLLRALFIAEAGVHTPGRHCHPLGEGRELCHGGAPPLAATATN